MKKKFWIVGIVVVVLILIAVFVLNSISNSKSTLASAFQTSVVERGDLTAIVGATGTVHANQTAALTWQTSGRVGDILVGLGDSVIQGQILAELAQDSLSQSIILAEADLISARRSLENLKLDGVARAQAQVAFAQAQKALEDAQNKRESKDYNRASQDNIDAARANYLLAQDAVDSAEGFFNQFRDLPEDNPTRAVALSQMAAARQKRDTALANLNWLLGKPDELEVSQADANLALAQANLDAAQREWDRLKDGPDPEDIAAAEARVTALEATLATSHVQSPFTGTVTDVQVKAGDLVNPGTSAFRLDDLSRLLVDVNVPEVDINRVKTGQITRLIFDAIQEREYTGKVIEVSRVGTTTANGVDFMVTIEMIDADDNVRPGMTAAVNIVVNQVNGVLLVPNRAVRNKDGETVVYVLRNDVLEAVSVQIGASSDTYTEIVSGDLLEGDILVLNPPTNGLMSMSR